MAGYLPGDEPEKATLVWKQKRGAAMASTPAATEKVEMLKVLFAMPPTHPTRMIANRPLLVLEFSPPTYPASPPSVVPSGGQRMCCASAAAVWSRTGCSPKQLLCTNTHYDLDSGESRSLDIMNEFYVRRRNILVT